MGRGEFQSCSPQIRIRERAVRWAHKLYEDDNGKTPIKAFCQELMKQLGLGSFIHENASEGENERITGDLKSIYNYALGELINREEEKRKK